MVKAQRVDRVGVDHGLGLHDFPPPGHVTFDGLAPGPVVAAPQPGDQRAERGRRVADQVDLVRVPHPDVPAVDVDLHGPGLAEVGQELGVGEAGAHGQQRVAAPHQLVAGPGAEQPDRAGHVGQLIGQHILAEQRLGHPGAEQFGHLLQLGPGPAGALPGQDRDLAPGVEQLGGPADGLIAGHRDRPVDAQAGRHHLERVPGRGILQFLHVGGDDDRGRGPLGQRRPDGPVQHVGQLLGDGDHLHVLAGHVLIQAEQVDFLLVGAAHRGPVGLAHDRHHRHVIELGVVQAVQQVDRARPRGRGAHAGPAGELRVPHRLERGHLLVPRLHEHGLVVRAAPGGQQAVDPVARVGEDFLHPPRAQPLEQVVGDFRSSHQ